MISREEVDRTILELEAKDTTFATCERLAWLYVVRDHLAGMMPARPALLQAGSESEFLQAAVGKDGEKVWAIMDDLMSTLLVVNPRAYESVMRRVRSIET